MKHEYIPQHVAATQPTETYKQRPSSAQAAPKQRPSSAQAACKKAKKGMRDTRSTRIGTTATGRYTTPVSRRHVHSTSPEFTMACANNVNDPHPFAFAIVRLLPIAESANQITQSSSSNQAGLGDAWRLEELVDLIERTHRSQEDLVG